jgi:hypothetical protein
LQSEVPDVSLPFYVPAHDAGEMRGQCQTIQNNFDDRATLHKKKLALAATFWYGKGRLNDSPLSHLAR